MIRRVVWTEMVMVLLGVTIIQSRVSAAEALPDRAGQRAASSAMSVLEQAARNEQFAFVFFWKRDDDMTRQAYAAFQSFLRQQPNRFAAAVVSVNDPRERSLVDRYDLGRAPLPMVLCFAPNGAISKAITSDFTSTSFQQAVVSPATARCLKALQDNKIVVLCVGNMGTKGFATVCDAAKRFHSEQQYAQSSEVVMIDPGDAGEQSFLKELEVNPGSRVTTTIVLAPPGRPVARFEGAVTEPQIVARLAAAQSSCCPGGSCGPGACR